ncbi:uncharacterized protein [Maniola hyperantus]|uniref:uncharacterized protein n=1 Tax=Aphantopus hyperantus TaxID=2795564 RepID=UPI001567CA6E|nr:uncharacterized protein LOC117995065 [Maniola hyperantus]
MDKDITNGAESMFEKYWKYVTNVDQFWIPLSQNFIKVSHAIYTHITFYNVVLFLIKFLPMSVFMYRFIKDIVVTSRERMRVKQLDLEELQLQTQIVETKLSVRVAEFAERKELLKTKVENFGRVRARVREIIANDAELININGNDSWDDSAFFNSYNTSEDVNSESRFIVQLLRELKCDQIEIPDLDPEMLSCGEPSRGPATTENSIYSSAADADGKQDCHVKIVKVTNVYRVAYLRHFIKLKRLRRANRQALLRKKTENIKKLLDDWQKKLSMVINSKLCLLPQVELASQEAMGDCSKPLCHSSDSDSDFINSTDNFHDNYSLSWSQNQYSPVYGYNNYDEFTGDTAVSKEYYDIRAYEKYNCHEEHDCNKGVLYIVPEETTSQMEIKEIESDADCQVTDDSRYIANGQDHDDAAGNCVL